MALFNFNILNPAATVPIRITLTGLYTPNQQEDARNLALRQERQRFADLMNVRAIKQIFTDIENVMNDIVPGLFRRNRILFNIIDDDLEAYPFNINAGQRTYTQTLTFHVKAYPTAGLQFVQNTFINLVIDKQGAIENYVNGLAIYNRSPRNQAFFQDDPNVQVLMNQAGGKRKIRKTYRRRRTHKKTRKQIKNRK
jgi:hypothetical protein